MTHPDLPGIRRRGTRLLGVVVVRTAVGVALLAGTSTVGGLIVARAAGQRVLTVLSGSMAPAFRAGDALLMHRPRPGELRPGQVVAFHAPGGTVLTTHRIVALKPKPYGLFLQTKGDSNATPDPNFTAASDVVAVMTTRLPHAGRWLEAYRSPRNRLALFGFPLATLAAAQLAAFARLLTDRPQDSDAPAGRGSPAASEPPPGTEPGVAGRARCRAGAAPRGGVLAATLVAAAIGTGGDSGTGAIYTTAVTVGGNTLSTGSCFYTRAIANDGPSLHYRLDDVSGTTATDEAATKKAGSYTGTWSYGVEGALTCSPNSAVGPSGVTSYIAGGQQQVKPPAAFTLEAWIKTTSANAQILGYGNAKTGTSTNIPRVLFLDGSGRLALGVATGPSATRTVTTAASYNDDDWHLVDVTFSPTAGTVLYVDGAPAHSDSATTIDSSGPGYWRVGYDNLSGSTQAWTSTTGQFAGSLDEVAVYTVPLTAVQVLTHYNAR